MTDPAQDLLWGCRAIAEHIGQPERQTSYLLETRRIPAGKVGARWVASRKALDEHFAKLTNPAPLNADSEEAA